MTLFFTELWERFGYYGMRAILILYMTDTISGGLGMSTEISGAIYGLFTFGVYALALPGGWIADRVIGQRQAVFVGGILIAAGYYSLGLPLILPGSETWTFYMGLALVVLGTGLLKPNVSAIVGGLYVDDAPARRDAGFSIFYIGINIGALIGPLICGLVGERIDWHLGFSLAGIGMTLGLIQYARGQHYLRGAGELTGESAEPVRVAAARKQLGAGLVGALVLTAAIAGLSATGAINLTILGFAQATGAIVVSNPWLAKKLTNQPPILPAPPMISDPVQPPAR